MAVIGCADDFDAERFGSSEEIVVAVRSGGKKEEYLPHFFIPDRECAKDAGLFLKTLQLLMGWLGAAIPRLR